MPRSLLPFLPLLTLFLFLPGLNGPFMLDDLQHLEGLEDLGPTAGTEHFLRFILAGGGGALGRPISLASFLLNQPGWPGDPWGFKYTNLMLHLLNGLLVFWLTLKLGRLLGHGERPAGATALAASLLWLLHPMQTSTVFYVIQRMTELSALFTLAGLVAWLHGRGLLNDGRIRGGWVWCGIGIGLGGILATLSKENGILIAAYALVIEYALLRPHGLRAPAGWRPWAGLFLFLPLLLLAAYVVYDWPAMRLDYAQRGFDAWQRLLTESRVLGDYLRLLAMPRSADLGIFHDDYPLSTGLLDPPSTLAASLLLGLTLLAALRLRHRLPLFSFAVLWFLAGHLLESTIIPLELYFEHRNYLPILGPLWALATVAARASAKTRRLAWTMLSAWILLLAFVTHQSSTLWGDRLQQSQLWTYYNPGSVRSHLHAADFWVKQNRLDAARAHLTQLLKHHPDHAASLVNLLLVDCAMGNLTEDSLEHTRQRLRHAHYDHSVVHSLLKLHELFRHQACKVSDQDAVILGMTESLIANPNFANGSMDLANLYWMRGMIYSESGNLDLTMRNLDRALEYLPFIKIAITRAGFLASAGLFDQALEAVELARRLDHHGIFRIPLYTNEIDKLEQAILKGRDQASLNNDGNHDQPTVHHPAQP
jgi:tetratricopeptide (TPR) repeat protein